MGDLICHLTIKMAFKILRWNYHLIQMPQLSVLDDMVTVAMGWSCDLQRVMHHVSSIDRKYPSTGDTLSVKKFNYTIGQLVIQYRRWYSFGQLGVATIRAFPWQHSPVCAFTFARVSGCCMRLTDWLRGGAGHRLDWAMHLVCRGGNPSTGQSEKLA